MCILRGKSCEQDGLTTEAILGQKLKLWPNITLSRRELFALFSHTQKSAPRCSSDDQKSKASCKKLTIFDCANDFSSG